MMTSVQTARWDHATPRRARSGRFCGGFILVLALFAVVEPWILGGRNSAEPSILTISFPGWETAPVPAEAHEVMLSERDRRFAQQFPGKIAAFADGNRLWLVRWVAQPTRRLHPASDCLKATGYLVRPASAELDASGLLWAGCDAQRGEERLRVRERIFSSDGRGWTDVSAWYWHAVLGRSAGPWWAVTVIERASK